ncbi:MAG: M1 family aminopeptidase [Pseudomonadota bacterium]
MTLFARRHLLSLVLLAAACCAHAEAPFSFAATPGKLPKDVVPVQYAAHLIPDLAANTFLGSETVEIDVLKATSTIMLNVANLRIDAASLSGKTIGQYKLTALVDEQRQTLSFKLPRPLAPARYQLALKFHGAINREARGLFHLEYKSGTTQQTMIATNMEPSDARRLLPSWDEPAFRANFKLTVDLPARFKAFSNTPTESRERIDGGLLRHTFRTTPKMPSYLLVLVAGELDRSTAKQDGVEIGVVTTAGKQASGAFALSATRDLLKYYNSYFGQPYPLPKLDQIAIPGGFDGAMENWGAIVYTEAGLLYDPKRSPDSVMRDSFSLNAHEVAHQWFGNLVTMAWWDNLWLNEGFASWMATKASEQIHPEWRAQLRFQAERDEVLNLDARASTHAIEQKVATEEEAADAFDAITYAKGEAFLRMLEAYLGEEPFRKGIRAYLARHQYANTTSADLWAALEKASGKPVQKMASDWTTQPGFPLLTVAQACEDGKRRVTLTQAQYRIDEAAADQRLWSVPVQLGTVNGKPWSARLAAPIAASFKNGKAWSTLVTGPLAATMRDNAPHTMLLSGPSASALVGSCDEALVVDPAGVGYFRVQYDSAGFDALVAQLDKLPDPVRLRLLADTWSLAMAGRGQLDGYLNLVARYGDEPRLAIWNAILDNFDALEALAASEPERLLVQRRLIQLVTPKFTRLGWQEKSGEADDDRQLRPLLALALARAGEPAAIAQGRALFQRYLAGQAGISPAMREFAIEVAARGADQPAYEQLAARALRADSGEERERLITALTRAADPALARRTLQLALSPALPAQVANRIVPEVARSGHLALAWEFALANRDALTRDLDSVGRNAWFPSLVSSSSDPADADMMERYVAGNFGPDAQAEAQRIANAIRTRAVQKHRLLPQVRAALK